MEKWVVLVCLEWFLRGDYLNSNSNTKFKKQQNAANGDGTFEVLL
jgi:hypothetical protein